MDRKMGGYTFLTDFTPITEAVQPKNSDNPRCRIGPYRQRKTLVADRFLSASPLGISCDLTKLSPAALELLKIISLDTRTKERFT